MRRCHFVDYPSAKKTACGRDACNDGPLIFGDLKLWRDYPGEQCAHCRRVLSARRREREVRA